MRPCLYVGCRVCLHALSFIFPSCVVSPAMVQGEAYTRLLMSVIRYAMPSNDKRVKKLTQLYLEIVGKCRPDGSLKEEMILVW